MFHMSCGPGQVFERTIGLKIRCVDVRLESTYRVHLWYTTAPRQTLFLLASFAWQSHLPMASYGWSERSRLWPIHVHSSVKICYMLPLTELVILLQYGR